MGDDVSDSKRLIVQGKKQGRNEAAIPYSLPSKCLVRIRVVLSAQPSVVVKTLVDWEPRRAGDYTETWDGRDSSGNRRSMYRCSIVMETRPLYSRRQLARLRAKRMSSKQRRRLHALHDRRKCHDLGVRVDRALSTRPLSGLVAVKISLDRKRCGYAATDGLRVRYYLDDELVAAHADRFLKVSCPFDTTKFANGPHVLTVVVFDAHDHSGSASLPIEIDNNSTLPGEAGDAIRRQILAAPGPGRMIPARTAPRCGSNETPEVTDETETKDRDDEEDKQCTNSYVGLATQAVVQETTFVNVRTAARLPLTVRAQYRSSGREATIRIKATGWATLVHPEVEVRVAGHRWKFQMTGEIAEIHWNCKDVFGVPVPPGAYIYTYYWCIEWKPFGTIYLQAGEGFVHVPQIDGALGKKWLLNYETCLHINTVSVGEGEETLYSWLDEDGAWKTFRGTDFEPPEGCDDELTRAVSGYALRTKHGMRYEFDSWGALRHKEDRNGNRITCTYSTDNKLTQLTDWAGRSVQFGWSEASIVSITDPAGKVWRLEQTSGRLTRVTDPEGAQTSYAYAGGTDYLMTSKTCPRGGTWHYSYRNGRTSSVTDPHGNTTLYQRLGLTTEMTMPRGATWQLQMDRFGQTLRQIDGMGKISSFFYGSRKQLLSSTNPLGKPTRFSYDGAGNVACITDALGNRSSLGYGRGSGGLIRSAPAASRALSSTGNHADRVTSVLDATGTYMSNTLDAKGNITASTNCEEQTEYFQYDHSGQMLSHTDRAGSTTGYVYSDKGQAISKTDALGNTHSFTHDVMGDMLSDTDPNGSTTTYSYDSCGRLVETTTPLGHKVRYAYDASGNLTRLTDGNSNVTSLAYGGCDRLLEMVDPLGCIRQREFDANGNMAAETDARGNRVSIEYDDNDSCVKKTFADGLTVTYEYDDRGLVTRIAADGFDTRYGHDACGRITSVNYAHIGHQVEYGYDAAGRRTLIRDSAGGERRYAYNKLGQLAQVIDPLGGTTSFEYDANGHRTRRTLPNGVSTSHGRDALGRITLLEHRNAQSVLLQSYAYTYDPNSNVTSMTDKNGRTTAYTYDKLNRLLSVREPDGTVEAYTYDAAGNRLTRTRGGVTTTYEHDAANRLTKVNGRDLIYDEDGNPLIYYFENRRARLTWDCRGRLTQIDFADGSSQRYEYDPLGRRVRSIDTNGAVTEYVYDGFDVIQRATDGNSEYFTYSSMDAPLVCVRDADGTPTYYQQDKIGSVVGLTNSQGSLVGTQVMDAWGRTTSRTGATQPLGFAGRDVDADTGLVFLRDRHYDPSTGRFLSKDMLFGKGPNTANLYVYVANNPVAHTDPLGLAAPALAPVLIGAGVGAATNLAVYELTTANPTAAGYTWAAVSGAGTGAVGGAVTAWAQAVKLTGLAAAAFESTVNALVGSVADPAVGCVGKRINEGKWCTVDDLNQGQIPGAAAGAIPGIDGFIPDKYAGQLGKAGAKFVQDFAKGVVANALQSKASSPAPPAPI